MNTKILRKRRLKTNYIKAASNMIWLMEISKICLDEQLMINYYVVKLLIFLNNPKYDGYQRGVASLVYKCFEKKSSATGANKFVGCGFKSEIISDQQLAEELYKGTITKFEKVKLDSPFIDNIWGADLSDMQLISTFDKKLVFYYVLLTFRVNMYSLLL